MLLVARPHGGKLYPEIDRYLAERAGEFEQIDPERKSNLGKLAAFVKEQAKVGKTAKLTFICTENSRRSHMSQLFAEAAARFYGIENVEAFSGGTEATAFNPRSVSALKRVGFRIHKASRGTNPICEVSPGGALPRQTAFSKAFAHPSNPQSDFAAVMTCSQADASCPSVPGATLRVPVPYDDPKASDGTERETQTYDERCRQISREMLYVFSLVTSPAAASAVD